MGGLECAGRFGSHEQTVQLQERATRKTIDRFNEAFNRHDADALAALLTEDTVFEDEPLAIRAIVARYIFSSPLASDDERHPRELRLLSL